MKRLDKNNIKGQGIFFIMLLMAFYFTAPLRFPAQTAEPSETQPYSPAAALAKEQIEKIETFVQKQMEVGKIPGMSIVIVKDNQTLYKKGFGLANMKSNQPVTPGTLFELGSNSKAFTGLGILLLEEQGLLHLNDPLEKYLPWFKMRYQGHEVPITVSQLLYHTSGVPFNTISAIPASLDENALEETVKTLVGQELAHPPGEKFLYATINYDVLGLIIQKASGQFYEDFMREKILTPLGLNNTYLCRKEAESRGLAAGYKICLKKPAAYDAPIYRGNIPAGYFMTNGEDLEKWLKIQLGTDDLSNFNKALIEKSHQTNPDLPGSPYAAGWYVFGSGAQILHGGANPNFSSFLALIPSMKIGLGVLTNLGVMVNLRTDAVSAAGRGIVAILTGEEPRISFQDLNSWIDQIAFLVLCVMIPLLVLALVLLIFPIRKIIQKKRKFNARGIKGLIAFVIASIILAALVYVLAIISTFFNMPGLSWNFLVVWTPASFSAAALSIFLVGVFFYLNFLCRFFFPKASTG